MALSFTNEKRFQANDVDIRSQLTWWSELDSMLKFQQLSGYIISVILQIKYIQFIGQLWDLQNGWWCIFMALSSLAVVVLDLFCHQLGYFFVGMSKLLPALREFCPAAGSNPSKLHLMSSMSWKKKKKSLKSQQNQTHINFTQQYTVTVPEKLLAWVVDWSMCLRVLSLGWN